jgi:zinc protease
MKDEGHGVKSFEVNGLKVLVRQLTHLPVFSMRWIGWGGGRMEPTAKGGLGALWSRSVATGGRSPNGRNWTRNDLSDFVDATSASLSAFHGKNSWGFQLDGLSDDLEKLLDPFFAVSWEPSFDPKVLDQEKKHQLLDLKTQAENPNAVLGKIFASEMFGKHAYGRGSLGDERSVKGSTRADLLAYHKKMLAQPQVLSIVGNIDPEAFREVLVKALAGKRFPTASGLKKKQPVKTPKGRRMLTETLKKEQTHVLWGFPTCSMDSADRWKLLGLSSVLSGQAGRLFIELRDKMSLCYSVAPTHMEGLDAGYFAFYIGTSPEKAETAIGAMEKELIRLCDGGVPESEWEKARTFLTGNHQLGQQSFSSQAMGLALDELYGLGVDEYFAFDEKMSSVKAADLQAVARKYLDPRKAKTQVLALVGPGLAPKGKATKKAARATKGSSATKARRRPGSAR